MKKRSSVLLILTFAVLSVSVFYPIVLGAPVGDIYAPQGTSIPDGAIDGTIGTEWDDAGDWVVTDLTISNNIRAKHDGTYLYILLVIDDATLNPFGVAAHDWAGVEFDINGDEVIMGSTTSPDDFEYCDYQIWGGEDWWMTGIVNPRGNDPSVGGLNDVVAAKGFNTTHTVWEFKKKLDSGDTSGYDITMDPSQTGIYGKDRINIALAYQDGQVGMHWYHSSWYLLFLLVPPQYNLTIYSLPTGVTFTVDSVPHTTPWSGTYSEGASVSLVMPETHDGYVWSHWLEDGDANRTKTVTIDTNITLTAVFACTFDVVLDDIHYPVSILSNSTVSNFNFNQTKMQISFNVTGESGTTGYCNVTIPKSLLTGSPWTIKVDDTTINDFDEKTNDTHTFLYFTHTHESPLQVTIEGTWVVPEFPSSIILPLFMILSLVTVVFIKHKKKKQ